MIVADAEGEIRILLGILEVLVDLLFLVRIPGYVVFLHQPFQRILTHGAVLRGALDILGQLELFGIIALAVGVRLIPDIIVAGVHIQSLRIIDVIIRIVQIGQIFPGGKLGIADIGRLAGNAADRQARRRAARQRAEQHDRRQHGTEDTHFMSHGELPP